MSDCSMISNETEISDGLPHIASNFDSPLAEKSIAASGAAGPPVALRMLFIPAPPVPVMDPSDKMPSAATF